MSESQLCESHDYGEALFVGSGKVFCDEGAGTAQLNVSARTYNGSMPGL